MLDIFAIAYRAENNDNSRWVVHPDDLYPAAIEHIAEMVRAGRRPDGVLGGYYDMAAALPEEAWGLALDAPEKCPEMQREARADALEIARLWFTEMLHSLVGGGPLRLHILADNRYRLGVSHALAAPTPAAPARKPVFTIGKYTVFKTG